jgi:hypothetical protein
VGDEALPSLTLCCDRLQENHINKNAFTVPFVCGCRNLGEALRRIAEGASMIRTKGQDAAPAARPSTPLTCTEREDTHFF